MKKFSVLESVFVLEIFLIINILLWVLLYVYFCIDSFYLFKVFVVFVFSWGWAVMGEIGVVELFSWFF